MDGVHASLELDTLPPEELEEEFNSDEYNACMAMIGRPDAMIPHRPREAEDPESDEDNAYNEEYLDAWPPGVPCEDGEEGEEEVTRSPATADTQPNMTAAEAAAAAARGGGVSADTRTRKPRVARRWRITFNNPPGCDEDFKSLLEHCEWVRGAVFQRERGENTGTVHYECYIEAKRAVSQNQVKTLLPLAHIQFATDTREGCIAYCSKTETRVSGPYTVGSMKLEQGKRNDIIEFAQAVLDPKKDLRAVVRANPDMVLKYGAGFQKLCSMRPCLQRATRRVIVIMVGPTGCGKTRNAIQIGGEDWHWKTADGSWFDGYVGQKTVIIDEVTACDMPLSLFLQLIDRYVFRVPVKGGFTEWNPDTVVMTSNATPAEWFDWHEEGAKRKRNAMTVAHFRAFARRVTEYWEWQEAGPNVAPRKLVRAVEFGDSIDLLFEARFDWGALGGGRGL